jgi:hypothetical protein
MMDMATENGPRGSRLSGKALGNTQKVAQESSL